MRTSILIPDASAISRLVGVRKASLGAFRNQYGHLMLTLVTPGGDTADILTVEPATFGIDLEGGSFIVRGYGTHRMLAQALEVAGVAVREGDVTWGGCNGVQMHLAPCLATKAPAATKRRRALAAA